MYSSTTSECSRLFAEPNGMWRLVPVSNAAGKCAPQPIVLIGTRETRGTPTKERKKRWTENTQGKKKDKTVTLDEFCEGRLVWSSLLMEGLVKYRKRSSDVLRCVYACQNTQSCCVLKKNNAYEHRYAFILQCSVNIYRIGLVY